MRRSRARYLRRLGFRAEALDPQAPESFASSRLGPAGGAVETLRLYRELIAVRGALPPGELSLSHADDVLRVRRGDYEQLLAGASDGAHRALATDTYPDAEQALAQVEAVLNIPPELVLYKGRLQPGRMLLVDTGEARIVDDEELKLRVARAKPYRQWIRDNQVLFADLPAPPHLYAPDHETVRLRQVVFGYTNEDLSVIMAPMATTGTEPLGSMGNDAPLAVLSERSQLLYNYFRQLFAQVTNPPIDSIREELVMSVETSIGPERNLLEPGPESARQIEQPSPILSNEQLEILRHLDGTDPGGRGFKTITLPILYKVDEGGTGVESAAPRARACAR